MSSLTNDILRFFEKLIRFCEVVYAVILQDMRTRFRGGYFGFIIAIAWPLTHLAVIVVAHSFTAKYVVVGDNITVFFATGALPYILCFYPGRMMCMLLAQNKMMLSLPEIMPIHLITARLLLEMIIAIIVIAVFFAILSLFGIDFVPADVFVASQAIAVTLFLGAGIGMLNVICIAIFGTFYAIFYYMIMLVLFLSSGAYFPVIYAPSRLKYFISFNPFYHVVNWLRSSYYIDLLSIEFDRSYIIGLSTFLIFVGLLGERFVRGRILSR